MKRWPEIDALRGFMLLMMTITHVPTRFSGVVGQPLGYVSAAEGFVFLSAFMAGLIFSRRAAEQGIRAMLRAFLARAGKLYACHVTMLAFLFTVIALLGIRTDRLAIKNLISFYLAEPVTAIGGGLILVYNPPLLDILPMYVIFMIVSPVLLAVGLRWSWMPIFIGSAALWMGAQLGLEREIYEASRDLTGIKVPYHETGAFDLFAWQLVWFLGLWLGAQVAGGAKLELPAAIVYAAVIIATAGLAGRYLLGQASFEDIKWVGLLLGKWRLGPLRVLNFVALAVVIIRFAPVLKKLVRWRALESLGAASLPVFCAHLVAVLLILALVGDARGSTLLSTEIMLLAATFAAMFATAWTAQPRRASGASAQTNGTIAISASAGR